MPQPLYRVLPSYPFMLRKKGITGSATVEFIVTKKGDVVNAHAVQATHPDFALAAEIAISRWKFRPGKKDGRPVNCRMQQTLAFDLHDDPPSHEHVSDTTIHSLRSITIGRSTSLRARGDFWRSEPALAGDPGRQGQTLPGLRPGRDEEPSPKQSRGEAGT